MSKVPALLALVLAGVMAGCGGLVSKSQDPPPNNNPPPPPPPPPVVGSLKDVNHIIYMLQENRSFDHYFGQLNTYRISQGLGPDVNGTPSNASQLSYDKTTTFTPFHMNSLCVEDLSSYWNESHNDRNHTDPTSATATMDGYAHAAGGNSRNSAVGYDFNGQRVMGYYDDSDLPYYYFMATQFAMSDAWFSPVMTNTPANRLYAMAATSHGVVNKPLTQINIPTIFDRLDAAGISWKNYVPDFPNGSSLKPFPIYSKSLNSKIVPMSEYFTDLQNGTLPQVAFIDRDSKSGLDEHPGGVQIQRGAAYVAKIINALMTSSSWQDSIFFLSYDEGGGFFDHVPPAQMPSPDGIPPVLGSNDTCTQTTGPACDFVYTGFRLPNFVVSPFSKAHYVDHTPMDTTAILKLIEMRFGLKALTARDAAQPDITYFFDFTNKPNLTPPTPPSQPTSGPCYITTLP
jgi:phospholipase C